MVNEYVKNMGLGLLGRLLDFGAARLTSSGKSHSEQRMEQIDHALESLESAPADEVPARPATEAPESQNTGSLAPAATITTESPAGKDNVAIACVPCTLGHFSTSAGLLNEAVRFKLDGMTSNEIIDRVAKVLQEQNALERVDLTPEKILNSPEWERDLAEEALQQSRSLRHRLETIETIEELEQAAADTSAYYRNLNREWWKRRFAHRGDRVTQEPLSLEEAKKLASEGAAKEVEERWYSQEKT